MAEHSMLFLSAISQVHNGSGTGLGLIDNPIMRETTTQFPTIQSSSIKGVLRDEFENKIPTPVDPDWQNKVMACFGPEQGKGAAEYAGAINFGDGQVLAFPVRSLKGCFVWATSPLILHRFYRSLDISGKLSGDLKTKFDALRPELQSSLDKVLLCPSGKNLLLVGEQPMAGAPDTRNIILEEFPKSINPPNQKLEDFAKVIAVNIFPTANAVFLRTEFEKKLVVLPEDSFKYFVMNATDVVPNIRIGGNGTTADGSLRYTEYLPIETVMYSIVSFQKSRHPKCVDFQLDDHTKVKSFFEDNKPEPFIIQIGGDETIGKGVVQVTMI